MEGLAFFRKIGLSVINKVYAYFFASFVSFLYQIASSVSSEKNMSFVFDLLFKI